MASGGEGIEERLRQEAEAQWGAEEERRARSIAEAQRRADDAGQQQHEGSTEGPEDVLSRERGREDELGSMIATLAQLTAAALATRKKEHPSKAIKQMERAVKACEGKEQAHPALAVEAARVRLNFGAVLSAGGRHLEALAAIKEAQRGLAGVLSWADECSTDEPGVATIAAEARALQCAALVAEGIELEGSGPEVAKPQPGQWPPPPETTGIHVQLYEEAQGLAEERLPARHPVAALARRLRAECAVCVPGGGAAAAAGSTAHAARPGEAEQPRCGIRVSLPPLVEAAAGGAGAAGAAAAPWQLMDSSVAHTPMDSGRDSSSGRGASPSTGSPQKASPSKGRASTNARGPLASTGGSAGRRGGGHKDIFAEFLREAEAEMDARRHGNETWAEDARKRLGQIHRTTRLMLEQSDDADLKDKKYTHNGHKVMMHSFLRENRSRSDPSLVREARKAGASPEVFQVRKYNKELHVKPPTPPPPPPPPKPVMDESLARALGRPKAGSLAEL